MLRGKDDSRWKSKESGFVLSQLVDFALETFVDLVAFGKLRCLSFDERFQVLIGDDQLLMMIVIGLNIAISRYDDG